MKNTDNNNELLLQDLWPVVKRSCGLTIAGINQ